MSSIVNGVKTRIHAVIEGPAARASPRLQQFLNATRNIPITALKLGRKPINKPVQVALDAMSRGGISTRTRAMGYDALYHNYLLVTLSNGHTYKLEKNETVQVKNSTGKDFQGHIYPISLPHARPLTVAGMIARAAAADPRRFWIYMGDSDNCQRFTRDMILGNGLSPGAAAVALEPQNVKPILDTLGPLRAVPNFVTDLAAVKDRVVQGYGI